MSTNSTNSTKSNNSKTKPNNSNKSNKYNSAINNHYRKPAGVISADIEAKAAAAIEDPAEAPAAAPAAAAASVEAPAAAPAAAAAAVEAPTEAPAAADAEAPDFAQMMQKANQDMQQYVKQMFQQYQQQHQTLLQQQQQSMMQQQQALQHLLTMQQTQTNPFQRVVPPMNQTPFYQTVFQPITVPPPPVASAVAVPQLATAAVAVQQPAAAAAAPRRADANTLEKAPFDLILNDECPAGFDCPDSKNPSKCSKNHQKYGDVIKKDAILPKNFCKFERPWQKKRCNNPKCFFAHLKGRSEFMKKASESSAVAK